MTQKIGARRESVGGGGGSANKGGKKKKERHRDTRAGPVPNNVQKKKKIGIEGRQYETAFKENNKGSYSSVNGAFRARRGDGGGQPKDGKGENILLGRLSDARPKKNAQRKKGGGREKKLSSKNFPQ